MRCAWSGARGRRGILLAGVLALQACGMRDPVWTEYEENTTGPAAPRSQMMPRQQAADRPAALKWTTPTGWKAQPGSSMRLGSFGIEQHSRTGLCTIVKLGGAAGGVEANVKRWIGQIGLEVPPQEEFAEFMDRQTEFKSEGGLECVLVDLTTLGTQGPEQASLLGAVFALGDMTVFVKFAGPVALLQEERASFTGLCRSFTRGDG